MKYKRKHGKVKGGAAKYFRDIQNKTKFKSHSWEYVDPLRKPLRKIKTASYGDFIKSVVAKISTSLALK